MYSVYCDGLPLYVPQMSQTYCLQDARLTQQVNVPSSLQFTIMPDHPYYNVINRLSSRITIYRDGVLMWVGRPIESNTGIYNTVKWVCEDAMAYLCDSVYRPFEFNGSPTELFTDIINNHNGQVQEFQQITVGTVTVTDPNDYIVRSSVDYATSWETVKEKLLGLGGYLMLTYSNGKPVLNWYASPPDTSTQVIEFGENIQSFTRAIYASETYTACVPLGVKDDDGHRLTVSSVNNGSDTLINTSLAGQIGTIFAPPELVTWEDVTLPENLKTKGLAWLNNEGITLKDRVELKAVDLHNADANIEAFQFLDHIVVSSAPHGLSATYILTEITTPLNDPSSSQITLGGERVTLVNELANQNKDVTQRVGFIEADYVTNGQALALANEAIESSTWIRQTAEEIVSGALEEYSKTSDLEALYTSIQSQFSQLASQVSLQFNTIEQTVTQNADAVGGVQNTLQEYNAWFRFLAQTSTQNAGLVIGESTSPIQMKLENDVLYFCTDPVSVTPETAIAYFSAGQLFVNFINVQNLTIGMTGKWLDVRIVGTGVNTCALFSGRLA